MLVVLPLSAIAAPYAAYVIDSRTGEVLHEHNATSRLHPASLTKMMTLYIAFEAVSNGEITMDTLVTVSKKAAAEEPSKLGLRAGQKIKLRYLVRAAAVKSANDAATAIGEGISGSEAAFARRMNRTAKALGMTRTTFKNMHGLTEEGHLSTAQDMTILGRHLLYDYPQYYNLFSRTSADAGGTTVYHTNRRFLAAYKGADGIKTGYTRAAGFNLTASAQRGDERVIVTVFGGKSTASRNAKVAELMDLGFRRAPSNAPVRKPGGPVYTDEPVLMSDSDVQADGSKTIQVAGNGVRATGKVIRVSGAITRSLRPTLRPGETPQPVLVAQAPPPVVSPTDISAALVEAQAAALADATPAVAEAVVAPKSTSVRPVQRPEDETIVASLETVAEAAPEPVPEPEVVTRLSTSGGRHWGVNVGRFPSRYHAEKILLKTALTEMSTLDGALRKVVRRPQGFDAHFVGMTRDTADLACRRLQARNMTCFMVGPAS
nr:D-alanyl-D-alanine carboxypeptidase family protein [Pseudosulfitobacter koreense]